MKFRMLFSAMLIDFPNSKVCQIGEWSIDTGATWYLQTCCKLLKQLSWSFWLLENQLALSLWASSSWVEFVEIRLDTTWYLQTCCKLLKQLESSLWIIHLQQTCYYQAAASDAKVSWCRLGDCKAMSSQYSCCNWHECLCWMMFDWKNGQ